MEHLGMVIIDSADNGLSVEILHASLGVHIYNMHGNGNGRGISLVILVSH